MPEKQNKSACPLCPALCELSLAWTGPDLPRVEVPPSAGAGVCPRGTALGELLSSPRRIRWPRRREGDRLVDLKLTRALDEAARRIMADGAVVLIDAASLPIEEIAAAGEIASAWKEVALCCVVAPEDEQMLLGVEASGATYLADEELAGCDGFVIVGDALASNPRCARAVLDALKQHARAPLVAIDSAGGVAASYATLRVPCRPGGEAGALAGKALAAAVEPCTKLGVILAAEGGRGGNWARVGFQAGKLAIAARGGVSVQTVGANALAALRAAKGLSLTSLAEAMTPAEGVGLRVVLGVDVLGMLGWSGPAAAVAAAAVGNQTTASAELILPLALPCEVGGTFLQAGTREVKVSALLPPPAGVPSPAELLRQLALAAGIRLPVFSGKPPTLDRLPVAEPPDAAEVPGDGRVLVAARESIHHGEGALTGQGSWQGQLRPLPELRISPADAAELGVADLAEVQVATDAGRATMRARVAEGVAAGTLAASEGYAQTRRLLPYAIESERDVLVSRPAPAKVTAKARAGAVVEASPPRHLV